VKKRTKKQIERLAADLDGRLAWLDSAWGCRTEYEVDMGTGETWVKITMPANTTALVIRCDVSGITIPGTDPRP
jgi:hypothetical protein